MDIARKGPTVVYWIGQPISGRKGYSPHMARLNGIAKRQALKRPDVRYVSTWASVLSARWDLQLLPAHLGAAGSCACVPTTRSTSPWPGPLGWPDASAARSSTTGAGSRARQAVLFPTPQFSLFFLVGRGRRLGHRPAQTSSGPPSSSWPATCSTHRGTGATRPLLAAFTLAVFGASRLVASSGAGTRRRTTILTLAVVASVLVLAVYKYFAFFVASGVDWLYRLGFTVDIAILDLVVPIGMSFTVFRAISYLVDVHRDKLEPPSVTDFALFMSYFPHISSGPLQRADDFLHELDTGRDPARIQLARAFMLIGLGLVKKMLVADYLMGFVEEPFLAPDMFSSFDILFAVFGYGVQLYCDFSGYIDLALGISLLLGIELPINFNRPYSSASLREFWRRWNITLSEWLRDYVYIPLGGSRVGRARGVFNLLVTWLVAGLWHGAGWGFVVWGLLHGAGLAVERAFSGSLERIGSRAGPPPAGVAAHDQLRHARVGVLPKRVAW